MAQSPDHPELAFVQAKRYAPGRPDGPPLWIVVHDMEATEIRTRAENTANYFATLPDGRSVSAHYCVDNDSVVQCVRLGDVAFTVGNRPGNYRGINWEFSGFAAQTRTQWLDAFGRDMFAQAAPYIRADAARFGIPLVRRSVAELAAFKAGVTSHNDLRLAFGGTTHTDPGPNFPWDYFMTLINHSAAREDNGMRLFGFQDKVWRSAGFGRAWVPSEADYRDAVRVWGEASVYPEAGPDGWPVCALDEVVPGSDPPKRPDGGNPWTEADVVHQFGEDLAAVPTPGVAWHRHDGGLTGPPIADLPEE